MKKYEKFDLEDTEDRIQTLEYMIDTQKEALRELENELRERKKSLFFEK